MTCLRRTSSADRAARQKLSTGRRIGIASVLLGAVAALLLFAVATARLILIILPQLEAFAAQMSKVNQ
ncbi:hypothetical protein [Kineosporia babensis]|uniref:Uncharacterized protein n=1 Tax=Kineosporia babensis TaxID=499548 RepID=A0A9X1NDI1_9ACTN|nr:hypothetical protein [Kineosporia babensis]MCD5311794.1 hypothetical protein [Kineosporia babensis]